ncbi:MAG TPA: 2-C-methyl-D-erythritol 4-phosphate cytidylyltransferase [Planctomycetota bacterium]|nr:2-C-methyl-D-erythritol 4-phosphate cytidylyltransferase [Planctomycetota bacterium]
MEAGVILVAAGEGRRFGGPKAFADLAGKSLLEWAAAPFASFRDRVAVLRREDLPRARLPGWKTVAGGPRRRDSVANGLASLDPSTPLVLIHDAARPLASAALVERVLAAAARHPAVVPAIPLVDTVKRVRGDVVVETLDRASLVAVQTPQAFRTDILRRALRDPRDATDEAALVEGLGEPVVTVAGDRLNVKITTGEDLDLVRVLLQAGMR